MMAAVGAGYAGAAMIHLLAHAVVKALLFLTAGVALSATESDRLADHGLARLKVVAVSAWIGAMGLATIPPLGAAFSKEQIVAALGQVSTIWAVLGAVAGGLSAVYALRFAWLGFGPDHRATRDLHHPPGPVENVTVGLLAAVALGSGALWVLPHDISSRVTGLELPEGAAWEIVLSLVLVALGAAYVALRVRASTLRRTDGPAAAADGQLADWLGLPALIRHTIVDPGLSVAAAAARFDSTVVDAGVQAAARRGLRMAATVRSVDQHVVDAGVEAAARAGQALSRVWRGVADLNVDRLVQQAAGLTTRTGTTSAAVDAGGVDGAVEKIASTVGTAGTYLRRTHTGLAQHYYAIVAAGLGVTVLLLLLLR
jgi:NADH:ubiquinone oxidoreductase subunit 5 (subunit L)/multisubunit Na+/H+ antiporter MnhA subunit